MNSQNSTPRLPLGRTVATPGALDVMRNAGMSPFLLLRRHQGGNWGEELGVNDCAANDRAVVEGTRILSAYRVGAKGEKLSVITEWDWSVTTILTPGEY